MAEKIQAIRGMNDVLPDHIALFKYIESIFIRYVETYGYQEIRTPLLENTQLFKRAIGEVTDVVEKEMYTFQDLNGDSVTMRPEGTAGVVRASIEHGLLHNAQQKLWYVGSMFRHEKPQKGRLRQFTHLGVEALGIPGVQVELELIAMCKRFFAHLNLLPHVTLQINTIGELAERKAYHDKLVSYFTPHAAQLDEESRNRLHRNPLRILDSKNKEMSELIAGSPTLMSSLGQESLARFSALCEGLNALGISYEVNSKLVRGLDYYGHTVFEWTTDQLGSQATVCAGGRYDRLLEQLGGQPNHGLGFAMGLERLALLMEASNSVYPQSSTPDICMIALGDEAMTAACVLAETLRQHFPHAVITVPFWTSGFKSQFKKADKIQAKLALILGDDEVSQQRISVKNLRGTGEQVSVSQDELVAYLSHHFANVINPGE